MSNDAETGITAGSNKPVGMRPAVEGHAEAVWRKYAIHLGEGWSEPVAVVVIRNCATIAGFIL